ncbi:MAG: 2-oxo acid dehydrogenase subunit E2 [Oscillospiraceae bacterium]|nr:2-oxo acid dehydrogenase subunit E2 [Oscillospiraceae bacterium]
MAEEYKRRHGDRRDGRWLSDLDALHTFMPYLYVNRADNEAFISETIDLTNLNAYLEKKNAGLTEHKYTLFHVILAAMVKTVTLRPKMNRFIQGMRIYQRHDLTAGFVVKKEFADEGSEALAYIKFGPESTIDSVHERIVEEITTCRGGGLDNSTAGMDMLCKLPRSILRLVMWILRRLDFYGRVPYSLVKSDPNYSTVFLTNLGSIGLKAGYHHLSNWGTTSVFVIIGKTHLAPQYDERGAVTMREVVDIGLTLDERIADGYYYSKTVRLLKHLLQNPELLERPASEEVDYE